MGHVLDIFLDSPDGNSIPLGQQCGGYVDPNTLDVFGFQDSNGNSSSFVKGFICPLGQICMQQPTNPQNNLQSYDNIFMALIQIIVITSANTVSDVLTQWL